MNRNGKFVHGGVEVEVKGGGEGVLNNFLFLS